MTQPLNTSDFNQLKAFRVEIDDHYVAEISLNRAESINSMNADFWSELPAIIEALDRESAARVIILSSQGRHFTAGMDLSVIGAIGNSEGHEPARAARKLGAGFSTCKIPLRCWKKPACR